jgi:hypothetical protein
VSNWRKQVVAAKSMELIDELKSHLPIPIYPTGELCKILCEQGKDIGKDTKLMITNIYDLGDDGGIGCSIIEENNEIFVVSLTHLRADMSHPLADKILNYQKNRIESILRSRRR